MYLYSLNILLGFWTNIVTSCILDCDIPTVILTLDIL